MTIGLLEEGAFRAKYEAFVEDRALAERCFDQTDLRELLEYVCSVMGRTRRASVRFPACDLRPLSPDHRDLLRDTLDRAGFGTEWCDTLGLTVVRPVVVATERPESLAYAM